MAYRTVQFTSTKAKWILDIFSVSIHIWRWRTRYYAWDFYFKGWRNWSLGLLEVFVHPVSRADKLRNEAVDAGADESPKQVSTED